MPEFDQYLHEANSTSNSGGDAKPVANWEDNFQNQ